MTPSDLELAIKLMIAVCGELARLIREEAVRQAHSKKPVCWFKHGPYDEGESLSVVWQNPHDDICYTPLYALIELAERAPAIPSE